MKKKIIIASSVLLIIASLTMHFFIKDAAPDSTGDLMDFIVGAMFGAGIGLPLILLNDKIKDQ